MSVHGAKADVAVAPVEVRKWTHLGHRLRGEPNLENRFLLSYPASSNVLASVDDIQYSAPTRGKIDRPRAQLEDSVARYIFKLDTADRKAPSDVLVFKTTRLKRKLNKLKEKWLAARDVGFLVAVAGKPAPGHHPDVRPRSAIRVAGM